MAPMVSELKRAFRERGLSPKKWMGQNLLVDARYLNRILDAAQVRAGEDIVEIGAGMGMLTGGLLAKGARVHALEVDAGFFRVLSEKFAAKTVVNLIHADALKYDFRGLAAQVGKLRVVANLPYSISSRLIFMFHDNRDIFSSLSILLQREVADRLTAEPSTKEYGVLTVLLGTSALVEILFHIPGRAFYPVPDVTSAFVRITFPETPPVPVEDPRLFNRLVKASFASRRKTLRNNLLNSAALGATWDIVAEAARDAGIDLGRRAEDLSPKEFARLADAIHAGLACQASAGSS